MSTLKNKQKQKQKADLIFNYMKSMNSFDDKNHAQDSKLELQRFLRRSALQDRQQVLDLTSQVYQLKVNGKQSKKVKFLDQVITGKLTSGSIGSFSSLKHQPNPENIHKDLVELQKSVFSQFKIKHDGHRMYDSLPVTQSKYLSSESSMLSSGKHKGNAVLQNVDLMGRSRSELLLNSHIKDKPKSREDLLLKAKSREDKLVKANRQKKEKSDLEESQYYNLVKGSKASGVGRSWSGSMATLPNRGLSTGFTKHHQLPNRSCSFWKQQNNLIVQIFKSKLQLKHKN